MLWTDGLVATGRRIFLQSLFAFKVRKESKSIDGRLKNQSFLFEETLYWFSCIKIVLLSMDILMFRFFFFIFSYRATLEQLRREPGAWTFWVSSPNKEQCNHCARILHHQLCIDDLVTYCKYSPFQRGFRLQFWLLEARFKCYDLYSDFFWMK